jgi:hypothetical protein
MNMSSNNLKLYGKMAVRGLALTLTIALLIGPAFLVRGASGVFVSQGYDHFTTPSDGNTYHNFYDNPIPAGFFNTTGGSGTSNQYTGAVPLKGVPLPNQGGADTVIQRNQDVTTPGTTTLTVVGLSLASASPLNVSFTDNHTEQWNMTVGLSQLQGSTGSMTISDNGAGGGTFDSSISIIPRFTFTRVSDGTVKVWDTGNGPGAPSEAGTRAAGTQSANAQGNTLEANRQAALVQAAAVAVKPCIADISGSTATSRTRGASKPEYAAQAQSAAAAADLTGGGRPINLTSSNTPWSMSGGTFTPGPPNEQDLLRRHQPSPTPVPCRTVSPI